MNIKLKSLASLDTVAPEFYLYCTFKFSFLHQDSEHRLGI